MFCLKESFLLRTLRLVILLYTSFYNLATQLPASILLLKKCVKFNWTLLNWTRQSFILIGSSTVRIDDNRRMAVEKSFSRVNSGAGQSVDCAKWKPCSKIRSRGVHKSNRFYAVIFFPRFEPAPMIVADRYVHAGIDSRETIRSEMRNYPLRLRDKECRQVLGLKLVDRLLLGLGNLRYVESCFR